MKKYFRHLLVFANLLHFCSSHSLLAQGTINGVIPEDLRNTEGNGNGQFFLGVPLKFQFIYQASEFLNMIPQGGTINGIAFRLDGPEGKPDVFFNDLEVRFSSIEFRISTTLTDPLKRMHPEYSQFQENVGSDSIIAFPPQSLIWKTKWQTGIIQPFDLKVPFDEPFYYDPQKGHLLIEMLIYEREEKTGRLNLDTSTRIIGKSVGGYVQDETGAVSDLNPVIQLDVLPVPEPSAVSLAIALSLIILIVRPCSK